jgi:hypothetical protein
MALYNFYDVALEISSNYRALLVTIRIPMNYPGGRIKYYVGKTLFISLFAVLQWVHPACAFKPIASGQNNFMAQAPICVDKENNSCFSTLPVIPGAVGPGMTTFAGSGPNRAGGRVIHVTTLANSGPGSLRAALKARGPRIVVFDVSGYISLRSSIEISEPFLTLAGQTAPFPGITIKGGAGLAIVTHDVLIQHIRIRVGDSLRGQKPSSRDAITIWDKNYERDVYSLVFDHVSLSWAVDENIGISGDGVRNISFVNSIVSEALWDSIHPKGPHSMGFIIGEGVRDVLVQGNLFAHNNQRNVRVQGDSSTLLVNNIIYNWHGASKNGAAGVYTTKYGPLDASIVGNVYIRGLDTRPGKRSIPVFIVRKTLPESRFFVFDNEVVEKPSDPWSVVRNDAADSIKVETPPNWPPTLIAKTSNEAKGWVLSNAGARRADGDAVDLRIISDVLKGTGRIIDSQDQVGGWLPLAENVRGQGGIPVLSVPANEIQPSGYTKVEEWLHRLAGQVEVPK